jgi:hypothetical protein
MEIKKQLIIDEYENNIKTLSNDYTIREENLIKESNKLKQEISNLNKHIIELEENFYHIFEVKREKTVKESENKLYELKKN